MELITIISTVGAIIIGVILAAYIVSRMIGQQITELQTKLIEMELREMEPQKQPKTTSSVAEAQKIQEKVSKEAPKSMNEEELIRRLREVIDKKVERVLDEAKHKKEKLLMLLDVARGYTLGYISEEEYNAFLMKVLAEFEEFKRLWLARFPSQGDREKLNQIISYISRTKLPIIAKAKNGKETIKLPPEEALIRITNSINNALNILDNLINSRGENPAVTPLEIKLSQECEKLRAKVERLEKQLQEYEALT